MRVVVDTSVWSLLVRRRNPPVTPESETLRDLVSDGRAVLLGVVRQELLSGIKFQTEFDSLQRKLSYFPNILMKRKDYEKAAEFYNLCRRNGIIGSHGDMLICAAAYRRGLAILTTDPDFQYYARHLPINLLDP